MKLLLGCLMLFGTQVLWALPSNNLCPKQRTLARPFNVAYYDACQSRLRACFDKKKSSRPNDRCVARASKHVVCRQLSQLSAAVHADIAFVHVQQLKPSPLLWLVVAPMAAPEPTHKVLTRDGRLVNLDELFASMPNLLYGEISGVPQIKTLRNGQFKLQIPYVIKRGCKNCQVVRMGTTSMIFNRHGRCYLDQAVSYHAMPRHIA